MKKLHITVLSWLLFHANQKPSQEFYKIKNRILSKYGKHICYDVQHFRPVKCCNCNGTGRFKCYWKLPESCWSCSGTGWYKPESWVILSRVRFGKYDSFHRPVNRIYEKPEMSNPFIEGYIEKTPTKYSPIALFFLFLIYEKGYLKRWYRETGNGWRIYWWQPRNWLRNLIHIIKKGPQSYPFRRLRNKISNQFKKPIPVIDSNDINDLPF